jgi:hypothetical protein
MLLLEKYIGTNMASCVTSANYPEIVPTLRKYRDLTTVTNQNTFQHVVMVLEKILDK